MAANNQRMITLPPFWTDNAAGWFAHVESRFRAKGVMEEWDRFDHTVPALSKEIVQLCFHAVAHLDDDELYTVLKEDLLQRHTLTKYQRIERLLAVGPLGSRRPTQLLAEIMELCPADKEASCFFIFFFLQRLPAWLRIQLEDDDQDDIQRLATKADRLFALHEHKSGGAVAVVESLEDEDQAADINAVQGGCQHGNGRRGGQRGGQRGSQRGSQRGGQQGRGGQGSQSRSQQQGWAGGKALTPGEATAAAGICWNNGGSRRTCPTARARRRLPAAGRETNGPGVFERCRPWAAGAHRGPAYRQAFSD
jgi:hypothetical protein